MLFHMTEKKNLNKQKPQPLPPPPPKKKAPNKTNQNKTIQNKQTSKQNKQQQPKTRRVPGREEGQNQMGSWGSWQRCHHIPWVHPKEWRPPRAAKEGGTGSLRSECWIEGTGLLTHKAVGWRHRLKTDYQEKNKQLQGERRSQSGLRSDNWVVTVFFPSSTQAEYSQFVCHGLKYRWNCFLEPCSMLSSVLHLQRFVSVFPTFQSFFFFLIVTCYHFMALQVVIHINEPCHCIDEGTLPSPFTTSPGLWQCVWPLRGASAWWWWHSQIAKSASSIKGNKKTVFT